MSFIKNNKRFIFLILILIFVLIGSFWLSKRNKQSKSPSFPNISGTAPRTLPISFFDVVPGQSSIDQVKKTLGEADSIIQQGDTVIESFKNPNSVSYEHEIYIKNETVSFVKEIVTTKDTKSVEDITSIYGQPKTILYGPQQEAGIYLYIYPDSGIAFLANLFGKKPTLFEVWYFSPTSLESFISSWATGYSKTKSTNASF